MEHMGMNHWTGYPLKKHGNWTSSRRKVGPVWFTPWQYCDWISSTRFPRITTCQISKSCIFLDHPSSSTTCHPLSWNLLKNHVYTLLQTNTAMKSGPGMKMYFLRKWWLFQCHVRLPGGKPSNAILRTSFCRCVGPEHKQLTMADGPRP